MELKQFIGNNYGWVDADGSYGVGAIAVFNPDVLTDEQWELLSNLGDNSRFEYVQALLNGDDVSEWEDN
jgi:hypothetical protein